MKTRTFVKQMVLLLSFLVGTTLQIVAQPVPRGPGGRGRIARFDLTQDQLAKMQEARQASENERAQVYQKLVAAQKEAIAAALAEKPDENAVRSKLEAVTKLQAEFAMLNFKTLKDVKFTDEQKEQLTSRPPLGYMVLFGGMGPGGMGAGFRGGAGRRGGGPGGGGGSGGVNN